MPVTITQGTTTGIATDLVGTTHYQTVKLDVGTAGVSSPFTGTLSSLTNLSGGTVTKVEGGTLSSNIMSGTQQTLGTVEAVNSIVAGTQNTLGTVGVINNLVTGTVAEVTTITNLTNGSVTLKSGTLSVMPNIPGGTINLVTRVGNIGTVELGTVTLTNPTGTTVNIATGTQQTLGTVGVMNNLVTGTLAEVTTLTNLTSGSVRMTVGTLTTGSLSNVAMLNAGSVIVTNGTIGAGTVSINTKRVGSAILPIHVRGTAGGTTWGTIVAPVGAGTYAYLNGLSIVSVAGTPDCAITTNVAGSTGAGVFARGAFPPGGGIARSFSSPIQVGTNGTIAYMVLNGTADFTLDYWVGT